MSSYAGERAVRFVGLYEAVIHRRVILADTSSCFVQSYMCLCLSEIRVVFARSVAVSGPLPTV